MTDTKDKLRSELEARLGKAQPEQKEPEKPVVFFNHKARPKKGSRSYKDIIGEDHPAGDFYFHHTYREADDWPENIRGMIPEVDKNHKFDHDYALLILMGIEFNKTVFAYGPPGTGKTTTPEQICARINRPFAFIGGMGGTEPSDYVGMPWVHEKNGASVMEWKDAMASFCVRNGVYLLYDEPFKASAQTNMCFQSLLDDRKTLKLYGHPDPVEGNLKAHKDFRICLADNVRGFGDNMDKYAAEIQDQSTLNRCAYKVHVDYVPEDVEMQILKAKYPDATDDLVKCIVSLANLLRNAWKKGEVEAPYSIRDTQEFVEAALFQKDIGRAFTQTYYGAIQEDEERNAVEKCFKMAFGSKASL
jgi:cobaltochelatase CobS